MRSSSLNENKTIGTIKTQQISVRFNFCFINFTNINVHYTVINLYTLKVSNRILFHCSRLSTTINYTHE